MNKNYLILACILITGVGFSQQIKKSLKPVPAKEIAFQVDEKKLLTSTNQNKEGETLVWEDKFDEPTNWTIDNSGINEAGFGWEINDAENSWYFNTVINSTSGGNFAELSNGNATTSTQALNVIYNLTSAQPIDLATLGASTNLLKLNFQQYGARFNDAQEIYISEDGISFIKVGDNSDIPVLSQAGGSAYTNPTLKSINLGQYLSANPTQLWIRFSWTTAYPNSADNPNVWITYGWMIDDVQILTYAENDIALKKLFWGSTGAWGTIATYKIPQAQIAPIDFVGVIENKGSATQVGVTFTASTTGFNGVSDPIDLPTLGIDTVETNTTFTPASSNASYTASFSAITPNEDTNLEDNTLPNETFEVNEFIYAVDKDLAGGFYSNQGLGFEVGNVFNIFNNATLKNAQANISSTAAAGAQIYVKLYEVDENALEFANAFLEVYQSQNLYTLTTADLGNWINIPFETPQELQAGKAYALVFGSYGSGGANNDFRCNSSGATEPGNSVYYDLETGTWYYTPNALMVRMDFTAQTPTITSNDPDNISCDDTPIVLTSSITSGNQWNLDGNPISGETGAVYSTTTSGTYSVTNDGLTSTAVTLTFNNCASIYENSSINFSIYPNPTNNNFVISLENKTEVNKIIITDNLGRNIETIESIKNLNVIETKKWNSGTYFISIYSNNGIVKDKIAIY